MKNLIIWSGAGAVLLLFFLVFSFATAEKGLAEDHGAPYWGTELSDKGQDIAIRAGCLACHSYRGQLGAATGPTLDAVGLRLNEQAIEAFIRNGTQLMPPFEGKLSDDEIKTLAQWLSTFKSPYEER
ncbi:c-type cytochrome [Calidifontibacillus erzurumensis]|uniref:Cytochrome c n=1 Tax=Calidifontibacillus erzurumensis TaxID=2741433 RepID=A0A8J8KBY9_9BACI|nr:cytochrome c [Calidifontibacillus erzurumensis]NSL52464.1 cytochrome c [Calidifontibacillus erzurumensis]